MTVTSGGRTTRVVGTVFGRLNRPHLLEAWGSRFNLQLEQSLAIFRYHDQPGMIGRVGMALGGASVNIVSAAVGRNPEPSENGGDAVMVITTDAPVPRGVIDQITSEDGFVAGRTVTL